VLSRSHLAESFVGVQLPSLSTDDDDDDDDDLVGVDLPWRVYLQFNYGFYRAMHFSAKRGIAIACRMSVRPSVRL